MPAEGAPPLRVLCLCAAWCHLCDAYAPVFDAALARLRRAGRRCLRTGYDVSVERDLDFT